MEYSDFTLEKVKKAFEIDLQETDLFPTIPTVTPPLWLDENLSRGTRLALLSEKSRSEFIVVPILLAAREVCHERFAVFSGHRLDIDAEKGLIGECDFILALAPSLPPLQAPIAIIVEAKKNDVEAGLGQCIAQMIAASRFNQAEGKPDLPLFGCVTTGEAWQFLRLEGQKVLMARKRYYLDNVQLILGVFRVIVGEETKTIATDQTNSGCGIRNAE